MKKIMTVGSLFSGIGAFDLGMARAGCRTIWLCEKDKNCRKLLADKFPGVPVYPDATGLLSLNEKGEELGITTPDIIIGGDPCPAHTVSRGGQESIHPDLSGYFLAVAGRLAPKWVVRENVPSPVTVTDFAVTLEALGYSTAVVWTNASDFIPESRRRAFVVGCSSQRAFDAFSHAKSFGNSGKKSNAPRGVLNCLVTGTASYSAENLIWEQDQGLRPLHPDEYEYVGGFPAGWTAGFTNAVRKRMCGNAVVPQVAEAIAREIVRASRGVRWELPDHVAGVARVRSKFLL